MGRFGNVMLVAGEPDLALEAKRGEVVRFHFTNTANTRVFNVDAAGSAHEARRRRQRPLRARGVRRRGPPRTVGARRRRRPLRRAGRARARAPDARALLPARGDRRSSDEPAEPSLSGALRESAHALGLAAERERIAPFLEAPPDKTLAFVAEMDEVGPEGGVDTGIYACPMDPRSSPPGRASARSAG